MMNLVNILKLIDTLKAIFKRDLSKLQKEIESYQVEANLWLTAGDISNSAGNLCLHLIGNLNHFIGSNLGDTGYVRQRDLEFSAKNVPRADLFQQIKETALMVDSTLDKMVEADLQKEYIIPGFKEDMTTELFLTHLVTHLSYHLGQINYHRRLLEKDAV